MSLPISKSRRKLSQGLIFWHEVGQGIPLVFLHGSWTDSSQWLPVLERLGVDYHCLAPDLLGFGESEGENLHYSIDLEVECLVEFFAALGLGPVYFIGHSIGGWIAMSYARKYPEQVCGLVLLAPEGVQGEGMPRRWWREKWLLTTEPMISWVLRSLRPAIKRFRLQAMIERSLQSLRKLQNSPVACQLLFQRRPAEIQAEYLQDKLEFFKRPVLILQGEQDTPAAKALSQVYGRLLPHSDQQIILEAGHDLPEALPDLLANKIREFVASSTISEDEMRDSF